MKFYTWNGLDYLVNEFNLKNKKKSFDIDFLWTVYILGEFFYLDFCFIFLLICRTLHIEEY